MAIKGVLDLQRRSLPLGEIRIGASEETSKNGKTYRKPIRLAAFRFTTPAEETAHAIAERLGGTPAPWDRRKGYWVVDTDHDDIDVWVPPRGAAVDAWMELWDGGKCLRRCDGITETRGNRPCLCPQPDDRTSPDDVLAAANQRKKLAADGKACKPRTRINLAIPWLPGAIGVWRLNTGSANAAVETADTGEILERAQDMDVYLPAGLLIHWRPGQDGHPYPVPVLRPRPSAEQIAQLPAGMDGMLAMSAKNGPLALTSAPAPEVASSPADPAPVDPQTPAAKVTPEQIAAGIPLATCREDVGKLIARAKAAGLLDRKFWYAPEPDDAETEETLRELLDTRWWELPGPPKRGAARQPVPVPAPATEGGESLFGDDPQWEGR